MRSRLLASDETLGMPNEFQPTLKIKGDLSTKRGVMIQASSSLTRLQITSNYSVFEMKQQKIAKASSNPNLSHALHDTGMAQGAKAML